MSTAAIIPARGGSKGIKDKNIVDLNGKPLIYYALKACHECLDIDYVAVSTDSAKIARTVSTLFPTTIIINRPAELASDSATSEEALVHAVGQLDKLLEGLEKIVFVQATSPLTEKEDLGNLLAMLDSYGSAMFYTEDYGHFLETHDLDKPRVPRQKRQPLTREAGNAWAFTKDGFLKNESRLFGDIGLCKIDLIKSYEIDEKDDLIFMKCLMNSKLRG